MITEIKKIKLYAILPLLTILSCNTPHCKEWDNGIWNAELAEWAEPDGRTIHFYRRSFQRDSGFFEFVSLDFNQKDSNDFGHLSITSGNFDLSKDSLNGEPLLALGGSAYISNAILWNTNGCNWTLFLDSMRADYELVGVTDTMVVLECKEGHGPLVKEVLVGRVNQ